MKTFGSCTDREHGNPVRIVQVLIHDHGFGRAGHVSRGGTRIAAFAKSQQLHEQALIRALRLPVLLASLFADIRWFDAGSTLRTGGSLCIRHVCLLSAFCVVAVNSGSGHRFGGTVVVSRGASVLAYRRDERTCNPAESAGSLQARVNLALGSVSHDEMRAIFIDFGELEAGLADSIFPVHDGIHPLAATLRRGAVAVAHALLGSWHQDGRRTHRALLAFKQALDVLVITGLPDRVTLRVSEGYAYYALHPETYALAAGRFAAERRPHKAVCLGIRSIGTSLSGVVAAALEERGISIETHTVRPHGHPFDRQISLDDDLARVLRTQPGECHFAVVDEGPGLSGSSFTSVVRALHEMRVDHRRIALFPSWTPDPTMLRSVEARQVWSLCRSYTASTEDAGFGLDQTAGGDSCLDFSAGRWRHHVLGANEREWPAVQPQHEVPKALIGDRGSIVRFAGLGEVREAKRARADRLAGAGFGAPPGSLDRGYLTLSFISGTPCRASATAGLVDRIADHLAFVVRAFPASRSPVGRRARRDDEDKCHAGPRRRPHSRSRAIPSRAGRRPVRRDRRTHPPA